jgi:para-nitrobenzyl esterase
MIRNVFAIALLATAVAPAAALAQSVAVIAAAAYTTSDTDIGTLLDDPAAKAVLEKVLPGFATNPQIEMARPMTMKSIQQYAADQLTDEKLAAVDAELAKLPPKK